MMKNHTLLALTVACFLGTLLAGPQSNAEPPSHAAETTDGDWIKHAANSSNAEIMMPAPPRLSERTFRPVADEPFIDVKTWLCTANQGQVLFRMSYHDLPEEPENLREIKRILDGAVRGAVAQMVGNTVGAVDEVKVRTYPGRKFTYEFKSGEQALKSDAEVYLIGKRQYMISTIFKPTNYQPELSKRFFETFNPFDPQEDPAIGGGDIDESEPNAGSLNPGIEGLTLPSGAQPIELK